MKIKTRLPVALAVAAMLVSPAAAPRPQAEIAVTFEIEHPEQGGNTIKITSGAEHTRMDMSEEASIVIGPESFIMIAHTQRMWMEFTREMMEQMQRLMGNMPGGGDAPDAPADFDPDAYTFSETGNSETILEYHAVEVEMNGPEGESATLLLAADAPTGLFEVFTQMVDELSAMSGPMMRGGPMGGGAAASMQGYMNLARARGMPAGKVLKLVSNDGVTITATALEQGPFGDEWKSAPADYTKRSMPTIPR